MSTRNVSPLRILASELWNILMITPCAELANINECGWSLIVVFRRKILISAPRGLRNNIFLRFVCYPGQHELNASPIVRCICVDAYALQVEHSFDEELVGDMVLRGRIKNGSCFTISASETTTTVRGQPKNLACPRHELQLTAGLVPECSIYTCYTSTYEYANR